LFCFGFVLLKHQIFIEVDVAPLQLDPNALWVKDWFYCVAIGGGQTNCSAIAIGHVPILGPFTAAELLVYGIGWVIFGFFVIKQDVLLFWKSIFTGNFQRIKEPALSSSFHESTHKSTLKSANKDDETSERKNIELAKAHPASRSKSTTDEEA
jgi:hypothetical protein